MSNNQLYIEDLYEGQEASLSKTISDDDIYEFARLSGDNNPVHIDDEYASKTIFKKRIAHGFLSASFISTLIASELPGPGSIYIKQSLKFLGPVFVGETILVKVKVIEVNMEKKRVKLLTECLNSEKVIITGEAEILVNSKNNL